MHLKTVRNLLLLEVLCFSMPNYFVVQPLSAKVSFGEQEYRT